MDAMHRTELIDRWIFRHTREFSWNKDMILERRELYPEADDELSSLLVDDPDLCFDICIDIARANSSDDVLGALGAKLSVLLETQRTRFLERLESDALRDEVLRKLLTWTIPDDPNSQPWRRIKQLVAEVPW
jgi:hypothetical protein